MDQASIYKVLATNFTNKGQVTGVLHGTVDILKSHGLDVDTKIGLTNEQVKSIIKDYDIIIVGDENCMDKEMIDAGRRLKLIGRNGVGHHKIDVDYAKSKGISVINCPTGNIVSTGELTCGLILALARKIPQATMALKSEVWNRPFFMGEELSGKTLAIIGFGKIGKEVAKRMMAFDMRLIGFSRNTPREEFEKYSVECVSLERIWPQADYITLHTTLNPGTKHLINDSVLKQCKSGVKIVNTSRGGCLDEKALLENLNSGQVAGAALDAMEVEPPTDWTLVKHPNVIATPHLGACTGEAHERISQEMANQILDFINGKPVLGLL